MKEILQVKMDLASIFILLLNWVVLELLDCSNDSRQFMFSEFPHSLHSQHGPLRCKTAASFRKLLNIRNIFRVAFLSCSHIRLEMCSGSLQGRWPVRCLRFVFLSGDNFYKISQCFGSVNNFFKYFLKSFFQRQPLVILGDKKMKGAVR